MRLGPDRPEGHYWLAADMGALAESFGLTQGMKYRSADQERAGTRGRRSPPRGSRRRP